MRRIFRLAAICLLAAGLAVVFTSLAHAQSDAQRLPQLQRDARQGNAAAQHNLAVFYRDGRGGLAKNEVEAARLFKLAAAQGDVNAQVGLGAFYSTGRGGLPRDEAEALRLYRLAAAKGDARAQSNIAGYYQTGRGGLAKDDREAARYYKLSADQGDVAGQTNLGVFYESGRGGLPKNEAESVRLYKLAADKGHSPAQLNLGYMHERGRGGLKEDDVEAVRLFRLAADQGNARAFNALGYSYEIGRGGLAKDFAEAVRYYKISAEKGDVYGQLNLANSYEKGRGGLEADDAQAARLYRLAADQGNARAQARLGLFYENGRGGLGRNDTEAARFYKLAADQGDAMAKSNLDTIVRRIPNVVAALQQAAPAPVQPRLDDAPSMRAPAASVPTHASIAAERRVALVIGNSAYQAVPRLANPANDAAQVAAALKANGFASVRTVNDATRANLISALSAFQREADNSDWAVIYYAGHGIEISGANYLIPVDAKLRDDRDVQDEAVPMNRALDAVASARKLKLVMLDACRDNPFLSQMKRVVATRSVTRGLAAVEPVGATLVVFAAKDGETAQDGDGSNSPFTASLVRRMQEPGVEINRVFRLVTGDVLRATANRQRPFVYGSLPGEDEYYFKLR
jgi:TPR repeat protein